MNGSIFHTLCGNLSSCPFTDSLSACFSAGWDIFTQSGHFRFFCNERNIKAPTATSKGWLTTSESARPRVVFTRMSPCRPPTRSTFTNTYTSQAKIFEYTEKPMHQKPGQWENHTKYTHAHNKMYKCAEKSGTVFSANLHVFFTDSIAVLISKHEHGSCVFSALLVARAIRVVSILLELYSNKKKPLQSFLVLLWVSWSTHAQSLTGCHHTLLYTKWCGDKNR